MHLFDPGTGENLTLDSSRAGTVPDANAMEAAEEVAREQDQAGSSEPTG
jgi:hypothetical protein